MAVYDGTPSIRLEGDQERALVLVPEAKALLYRVQAFKQSSGVSTFSMTRRVDDDSVIYVLSAHGQHIIHISVAPDVPEMTYPSGETPETTMFPDFYSGMVLNGYLEEKTRPDPSGQASLPYYVCDSFFPTPSCARFHEELVTGRQLSPRLAVRPLPEFSELTNRSPRNRQEFSQYSRLRASMYSGTMKKVAQIAMGLGRIAKAKMRDPDRKGPDSQYIREVEESGVQIRYDWRFWRTHGITRGADGHLWLVEISAARGVLARLLPSFPKSDTDGFRDRADKRGDRAMVRALDELGCLPTGECFPSTSGALNDLIARGEVLRLMDADGMARFYECSAYSSAMGWAFNDRGSEAHNTAYYYGGDGFQRGVWYQVNISIGAVRAEREPGEPIASGNATLRLVSEGNLYTARHPGARHVPIKFYEPIVRGLISHEAVSLTNDDPPLVDTVMFVAFVDGDLKTVRYYRNPEQDQYTDVEDSRSPGECLFNGSWTIREVSGRRAFPNMMYTNDFDDRKVLHEHEQITKIRSEDLGYDAPYRQMEINYDTFRIGRARCYKRTTEVERRGGENLLSAVVIPQYSREAYYYAKVRSYDLYWTGSTTVIHDYIIDPNGARSWGCTENFFIPLPPELGIDGTRTCRGSAYCAFRDEPRFGPRHTFHPEQRIMQLLYNSAQVADDPCSELADSGPWGSICQDVTNIRILGTSTYQPLPFRRNSTESWDRSEGNAEAELYLVSPGHGGPLRIPTTPAAISGIWFKPSPDEFGAWHQLPATHSAIGEDALVYGLGISTAEFGGAGATRGYTPGEVRPSDGYPAFIGVNAP